jgi:hypothetical protein
MRSTSRSPWFALVLLALGPGGPGCAADEVGADAEDVRAVEAALLRVVDRGPLAADQVVLDALGDGDVGHAYRYDGHAGETVAFFVDWHQPEAWALGAALVVYGPDGARVASASSLWQHRVGVTVTLGQSGAYRVVARPFGYALFGRYPYKVGAVRGAGAPPVVCVGVWITAASVPGFAGYAAIELEPGEPEDPERWVPTWPEDLVVSEREIDPVRCTAIVDRRCDAAPTEVCGSFPFIGPSIFPSECAVRDEVRLMAAECSTCAGLGGWGDVSLCPNGA